MRGHTEPDGKRLPMESNGEKSELEGRPIGLHGKRLPWKVFGQLVRMCREHDASTSEEERFRLASQMIQEITQAFEGKTARTISGDTVLDEITEIVAEGMLPLQVEDHLAGNVLRDRYRMDFNLVCHMAGRVLPGNQDMNIAAIDRLLERGCDIRKAFRMLPDYDQPKAFESPVRVGVLHAVAMNLTPAPKVLVRLMEAGANPHDPDSRGRSALEFALLLKKPQLHELMTVGLASQFARSFLVEALGPGQPRLISAERP